MALAPGGGSVDLPGEATRDPSFGLPAVWIDPAYADEAELAGYTVIPPESVIVTHVAEAVKESLPTLLTYAATQRLIDGLDGEYIKLRSEEHTSELKSLKLISYAVFSIQKTNNT